ncbi:MAG TPA: CehA/McbA family metallohydrolase [Anaerohalosphaeraceae bacterium]|jgi:hypothetical protein|nr:CehA/McbA family metallohydrolase [Anaerohalosphaeraceae bacterium]HRT51199.1 CehA/McbA family metallohydrolase [Anaerohalosphaeraceae bacterium]HRT87461.1 CehA/McbA family metallohydrolase [Anaerohalosphaeraceae bacterium]
MDRRTFIKTTGILTASAAVLSAGDLAARPQQAESPKSVNPFEQPGQWYKAAFHVHTITSDGDVDVPTRLAQYRKLGYSVVTITDHWKTNDLTGMSDDTFLAICGMEFHPRTGTGAPAHHLLALDLPHPFEFDRNLPAQDLVDKAVAAGAKVFYAHPYWTAHTLAEMSEITGYLGLEVYNGVCDIRRAKGFANVHWDQALNKGIMLTAIATDDVHSSKEINKGWTMIKAPALNKSAIMAAMGSGSFYASCGPVIHDFRIADGAVTIQCSPAVQIIFQFDGAAAGKVFNAEPGKTIEKAEWKLPARPPKWVRAEVIDQNNNRTWTNPIIPK